MAEMLIQSESLTAIADKIRVLSDTEDAMSLSTMESHINEANTNVAAEANLISQIAVALEGKAGGGNSSSSSIETGVLTITDDGMVEPGMNEYVLSSDLLQTSKRTHIILTCNPDAEGRFVLMMIVRETVNDSFEVFLGNLKNSYCKIVGGKMQVNENSLIVQGTADTTISITFLAW